MKPSPDCSIQDGCIARVHCSDLGYCKEGSNEPAPVGEGFLPSLVARVQEKEAEQERGAREVLAGMAHRYLGVDEPRSEQGAPANPKQAFGDTKLPLYLVPFTFVANVAVALFEGWGKYGLVNWRAARIEAMTYASALERHMKKWTNGEKCDPKTKVPHLANAAACIAILIDAEVNGTLIDNRPLPCKNVDAMIADLEATLAHLETMHYGINPKHYTIADNVE